VLIRECLNIIIDIDFLNSTFTKLFFLLLATFTSFVHFNLNVFYIDLHWLDVSERIQYKTGVTVHCCLQSKVSKYLADCCIQSQTLLADATYARAVDQHHLSVPRYRLTSFSRRAFSVVSPTVWNSLPESLQDPGLSSNSFRQLLKTDFFNHYSTHSAQ